MKNDRFVSISTFYQNKNYANRKDPVFDKVAFSINRDTKAKRFSLTVRIPPEVVTKARIIAGDKVDILIDQQSKLVIVRRISSGGWTLSKANSKGSLAVKVTWQVGMPSVSETVFCDYTLVDDGICFELPDECSFEKNLAE